MLCFVLVWPVQWRYDSNSWFQHADSDKGECNYQGVQLSVIITAQ